MRKMTLFSIAAVAAFSLVTPSQAADKVLTIYTYESFTAEWGPGPKVKAAFEKVCACTVDYVSLGDGVALLTRLKMEGAATKADIVLGLDNNLIEESRKTGLFAEHGIDTSAVKVPGGFSDPIFVPYDYGHFAVVVDTDAIKNPPKSLKELVGRSLAEDRHRRSADIDAGSRAAVLDEGCLWRQGAGSLDEAQEAYSDGDPRLVGSLWPVHQGRGANGALLYDVARLPHDRREGEPLSGARILRGASHPDRSRCDDQDRKR
jgi:hypothetical protein